MSEALVWERDRLDWPHSECSRFVQAGGLRWHVQCVGQGPVVLLIHGTGASTHSWDGLIAALADRYTLIAMDLPGHAFTATPPVRQLSLPGMTELVAALVDELAIDVEAVIGHSAGAAIAAQMIIERRISPALLIAINGAFFPFGGLAGLIFPPVARLMAATPMAARLFARRNWDRAAVERLIAGTGSRLAPRQLELYRRLLRDAGHAAGALGMMARWDLRGLGRGLASCRTPLALIVGACDRAVPPGDARRLMHTLPPGVTCSLDVLPKGGHLVHEEQPVEVARRVTAALCSLPSKAAARHAARSPGEFTNPSVGRGGTR